MRRAKRCARVHLGLLGVAVLGLVACTSQPVKPSPTADQVLAAQYRARGEQGAMRGVETQAVMDAYRQGIAKPAASMAGSSSEFNGGETRSH